MVEGNLLFFFHSEKSRDSIAGEAPVEALAMEEMGGGGNGA